MSKPKILVVDDERFFTNLLEDILKDDYCVNVAYSGVEALDIMNRADIELVLLDILMPGMDGYEVCRQIKQSEGLGKIPVIFLTIKHEIEDEIKGFDLGAADYIVKPISPPIVKVRVATQVALARVNEKLRKNTAELEMLVAERTVELSREITDKQKAYEKLQYLANYDQLTQLPNRNLFNERLAYAHKLAQRNNRSFSLLVIDLDRFKCVNDTMGHYIGDLLLASVGVRLSTCLRGVDTIARLGGDEFSVILVDQETKESAAIVAKKILEALSQSFSVKGQEIYIGASIGITSYPEDGEDVEVMFRHADMAMYEVKNNGKNAYSFFSPYLTTFANQRMELEQSLRIALLEKNGLYLNYQPIIDLKQNNICGVEALLRWQHPKYGQISPEKIISIAEESDLIFEIGEWILSEACKQYSQWQNQNKKGFDNLYMAINMSTRQFCEKIDSSDLVERLLSEYCISGHSLQLEITENLMLENSTLVKNMLHKLRGLGVQLSVDDFGTGYSSLSYLRRFPVDTLKIDRSFVHDLYLDSGCDVLIKAIIAMGQSLNLKVIAEGVETKEQLHFLQQQGCDMVQGYYFSKPVSAEAFERLIETQYTLFTQ